jgi:excisionase family DNA binding protein
MTVAEAAKFLGWSRWTVVRRIKDGDPPLPARKLGGATSAWVLERADVEALAALLAGDGTAA